jgi:hypothetical protein
MGKTAFPRHILWSTDTLDLGDPWQRRWYIRQTLVYGRAEDIAALDWDEVREMLPELELPPEVRRLWESFFAERET